ncbi:MAG: hypothetical protein A2Y98_01950 [Candidatus Portnoybacteria bacterium RBG_19FT_COMBO_36_7]|uniref:Uncharacterized protein n=1 Tax=Candidatus Portnoybacteria bacterium RBG_19FT_COMBO_36_7 TaxID=1801992 RepID=A0A1G2F6H7_9BACT|nr:MAG: hypothetical protein A2Y98_01950 [Candidatus Portnoybacteria bacterium RBG_19FT_COMBO_36_7]
MRLYIKSAAGIKIKMVANRRVWQKSQLLFSTLWRKGSQPRSFCSKEHQVHLIIYLFFGLSRGKIGAILKIQK